jgi:hypothetical protein
MTRAAHVATVFLVVAAMAGLMMLPASGAVTGGCDGSVTIDGIEYGPNNDTPDNPIVIPDRSDVTAEWEGSVPFQNTNFRGEARLVIGPGKIQIASWEGENADDLREGSGTYELDDLKAALPVDVGVTGIYEVDGVHEADGGTCKGNVFIKLEGNPLSTPLGIVSVLGLAISTIGLVGAAVKKG